MRKRSDPVLLMLVLAGAYGPPLSAAPVNPLVRPVALSSRGALPDAPPVPPVPPAHVAGFAANSTTPEDNSARSWAGLPSLSKYTVVAISGNAAVLRAIPGTDPRGADMGGSAQAQAALSQPGRAGGSSTPVAVVAQLIPSLIVTHGQPVMIQDVEAIPEIHANQVILRTRDRSRVLFYGRLDGMSLKVNKGLKLEAVENMGKGSGSQGVSIPATSGPGSQPGSLLGGSSFR